jgi:hypothetical protein
MLHQQLWRVLLCLLHYHFQSLLSYSSSLMMFFHVVLLLLPPLLLLLCFRA